MFKILLLQGANANYLGKREPAVYGSTTVDELSAMLHRHAEEKGYALDIFYTNIEGGGDQPYLSGRGRGVRWPAPPAHAHIHAHAPHDQCAHRSPASYKLGHCRSKQGESDSSGKL